MNAHFDIERLKRGFERQITFVVKRIAAIVGARSAGLPIDRTVQTTSAGQRYGVPQKLLIRGAETKAGRAEITN